MVNKFKAECFLFLAITFIAFLFGCKKETLLSDADKFVGDYSVVDSVLNCGSAITVVNYDMTITKKNDTTITMNNFSNSGYKIEEVVFGDSMRYTSFYDTLEVHTKGIRSSGNLFFTFNDGGICFYHHYSIATKKN